MFKSERTLWIIFAILWGLAILSGIDNVRHGEDPVLRYSGQASYSRYMFFIFMYLVGGAVVAILHSKLVENYPGATVNKTETSQGTHYDIIPARKFFAMWPTGAIGIIFVLALPYALFGYGIGLLFCLGFGGLLFLMAFVPKLWRPGTPHGFTIAQQTVQTPAHTYESIAKALC